jgi:type I restriction enzyme S subunit
MKKYPLYKETDVKGIPSIPKGWVINKIKFVSKTIAGGTPDTKNIQFWENGTIPWLPSGKVHDCNIYKEDADTFITELGLKGSAAKLIPANSILIALTGATCANIAHLHFVATANQSVVAMPGSKKIENRFLFYCLLGIREQILINKTGGAQSGINDGDIKNTQIPYPSLPEQISIVRFLDYKTGQIDNFIANRQKQIELLKEQKAGIINKAVTKGIDTNVKMKDSGIEWIERIPENWSIWKLKYLTKKISKGTTPSTEGREILEAGEIRFLKAENITPEGISLLPEFFIDEETNQILKRSQLQKNDILFVIAGATIGKAAIITDEFIPSNTNQAVCFIRLKKNVLPELILNQLQASYIKNKMAVESVVAAQPNISMEKIGNFQIFLPPMHEQVLLLKFVQEEANNFNTLISKYQKQIELMQEYRTSLISQAVTGKIDVREWHPKKQRTE